MPTYNYACSCGCTLDDLKAANGKEIEVNGSIMMVNSGRLVWEETHAMLADPDIKCPLCGGKAERTMEGVGAPVFYVHGNCYLNKEECRKQMDLHKLETGNDPYAGYRQPGEVDHIKTKLKKGPKKTKYFS